MVPNKYFMMPDRLKLSVLRSDREAEEYVCKREIEVVDLLASQSENGIGILE